METTTTAEGRIAGGEAMDVVAAPQREPWRVEGGSSQIKTLDVSQDGRRKAAG